MRGTAQRFLEEAEPTSAEDRSERVSAVTDGLAPAIERIRLRGYRRVLWQRHLWERTAQVPAQGLAIPHEEIDIVCRGLDNWDDEAAFYRLDPEACEVSQQLAEVDRRWQESGTGRFGELAALFSLSPVETDFLLLCVAPEFDPRLRRLYGYLHDDAVCCAPTLWLAHMLFEWDPLVPMTPNSALVRWLLAYPGLSEEQPWSNLARWMPDPRIVGFLGGHDDLAPSLQIAARWIEPEGAAAFEPPAVEALRRLFAHSREGRSRQKRRFAQLVGPGGIGRKTWTARVCAEHGLRLLSLDATRLLTVGGKDAPRSVEANARERLVRAEREALLQGCALYWDHAEGLPSEVWADAPFSAPVQLFGAAQPIRLPTHAPHADLIPFPLPTPLQARALWRQALPEAEHEYGLAALAERFTLTPAEIQGVAAKAVDGPEALWAACRSLSHGRLGTLATLLPCPFTWEDIMLPADTSAHLREIAAQSAHRLTVYEHWGFGRKRPLGRGVSALFAGPSGTGKTMAAQVLAAEMGVVLYRIDLASVVSKYVGETEKNLRQIFDEAERLNAVLFFDEADALFGKRTEVKDAHDRYANIEINYLLQRMESYEGLAILATNRKGDLDPAFLRRLRFVVDFPMPGVEERAAIWRLALPEQATDGTALLNAIDWDLLAARLEISGAGIKDIALGAAFLACEERVKIGMKHLLAAARREMAKHGRLVGGDEFGRYQAAGISNKASLG